MKCARILTPARCLAPPVLGQIRLDNSPGKSPLNLVNSSPWAMTTWLALWSRHPTLRKEEPGFNSHLRHGDYSGTSHTSDLKIDTPVAILPGAWRYRVSVGTGWLYTVTGWGKSLICNFNLSVAACTTVWADLIHPWDTLASCLDVKQATKNNNQESGTYWQSTKVIKAKQAQQLFLYSPSPPKKYFS